MKSLLILSALCAVAHSQLFKVPQVPGANVVGSAVGNVRSAVGGLVEKNFDSFKSQLNKVYSSPEEEKKRKGIFAANFERLQKVAEGAAKLPYTLKLNDFADMLNGEFNKLLNGFGRTKPASVPTEKGSTFEETIEVKIPDSIDWREKGAIAPVQSQQLCAGCYAFAAAGALEAHNFIKTGSLKELSVQNLIDCTGPYGNDGCDGGLMDPAFQYAKDNKAVAVNNSYPFEAKSGECRYKAEDAGFGSKGIVKIPSGNEKAMKAAVGLKGPVVAAIDASLESFQFYGDGVYYDTKCKNDVGSMNHAVLVVGYGTDKEAGDYWIVKNSYGPKWGKDGYFKIARNKDNHCGIATIASYPQV